MRSLIKQVSKFGVVGVIAFGIDYGLLIVLTEVSGLNYLLSATVSFIAALVFNYIASMRYVFKHKADVSRAKEFTIFAILSVIGLGLNNLIMWAGVTLSFDYRVVKLFATALVMAYNFITRKRLLDGKEETDPH